MSRRTVDIDLLWKEDSPLQLHFDNPDNEIFTSQWFAVLPPLPGARLISESVLSTDITPSPDDDKTTRWSFQSEVNQDQSAVRVHIRRWLNTRPRGVIIRLVLDTVQPELQSVQSHISTLNSSMKSELQSVQTHISTLKSSMKSKLQSVQTYLTAIDNSTKSEQQVLMAHVHSLEAENHQLKEQAASVALSITALKSAMQEIAKSVQPEWCKANNFSSEAAALEWVRGECYDAISQAVLPLGVNSSADMLLLQPVMFAEQPSIPPVFRRRLAAVLKHAVTSQQQVQAGFDRHQQWMYKSLGARTSGDPNPVLGSLCVVRGSLSLLAAQTFCQLH